MKKDDFINEDSIKDLIQYSEEEEDNTPEETVTEDETENEEIPDDVQTETNVTEDDYSKEQDFYDTFDEIDDTDYSEYDDVVFESDKKNTRHGIIIGVIIGIIAVIAFVMIDSGIIGNYKANFSNNFSKVFKNFKSDNTPIQETKEEETEQYNTEFESNVTVTFEEANKTEFVPYHDGVICAKMNYMSFIDETGTVQWEIETAIVDPILKAEGNYILLAENGRNKICLYNDKNLVYDIDDPDMIAAGELSANGDVVVVTSKASYKGGISVYNKNGEQIYSWASGSDAVICADISQSSRRVAVALLNTETTVKSSVHLFNLNEKESYSKTDIENSVIFDIRFVGDIANCFGDNRITGISDSGKIVYDNTFEGMQLTHSSIDEKGNKLLSVDNQNIPVINRYSKKGTLKESITLNGVTDFIDINDKDIIYNIGRDIYWGRINSNNMSKYTAAMDIKDLIILSDKSFVIVYSNSLEFVTR